MPISFQTGGVAFGQKNGTENGSIPTHSKMGQNCPCCKGSAVRAAEWWQETRRKPQM